MTDGQTYCTVRKGGTGRVRVVGEREEGGGGGFKWGIE